MKREMRSAQSIFEEDVNLAKSKKQSQTFDEITEIAAATFYFVGDPKTMTFDKVSMKSLKAAAWRTREFDRNSCVTIWDGKNEEWFINYDNVAAVNIHHKGKAHEKS